MDQEALPSPGIHTVSLNLLAMLTVVVQVELERGSGPKETHSPTILLEGPKSLRLLQLGNLETQEAEQELLARVQTTLASVGQGYSVSLLLRGRETEAPQFVPQLLQMLFEEALSLHRSDHVLSTLSLVQISPSGKTWDLLSPGVEDLSVLDVAPLGLVVEHASEVEVSDARAASELYLQAAGGEGRDCPLLRVLAGEAVGEKVEGSLPWIVSWLLEENNYSGLLIHLDPQDGWGKGSSLRLLQAALLGASGRRMQMKEVKPTWWDAVEEARARRASLSTLRLSLFGDTLTDSGLSQLGRALRELQFQQAPDVALQLLMAQVRRQRLREQHQIWIQEEIKHLEQEEVVHEQVKDLVAEEEVRRAEYMSSQFCLSLAMGIWVVLNKGYELSLKTCEKRPRWHRELKVLRLQVKALQAERDIAEEDLASFYDLHVQATRAQTSHILQVFRAWQRLQEEQAMTTEHRHRSLLACVLQDTIDLASRNQELQAQNQQLQQGAMKGGAVRLDLCLRVKPDD
ncbi:uncharacterized protein ACOB7L_015954 [Callospermophilus lateralis]